MPERCSGIFHLGWQLAPVIGSRAHEKGRGKPRPFLDLWISSEIPEVIQQDNANQRHAHEPRNDTLHVTLLFAAMACLIVLQGERVKGGLVPRGVGGVRRASSDWSKARRAEPRPTSVYPLFILFGHGWQMPDYIRPKVDAATVFFTVALARRGDDLLVRHV